MSAQAIPPAARDFWARFESSSGIRGTARFYGAGHFDDNETSANELAHLVVAGRKRATAGLLWAFDQDGKQLPCAGALSIITDWGGRPVCVIETTGIGIVPFDQVDADFAAAEGEGDGSLAHWRAAHWAYFGRECARLGRSPDLTMPVVCEHFRVIYREGGRPA